MPTLPKHPADFVIKESVGVNIFAAAVFYVLFFYTLFSTTVSQPGEVTLVDKMLFLTLIPALLYTAKAFKSQPYLTVNKNGIFIGRLHLTIWSNFISAEVVERQVPGRITDNFILIIEYYRDGLGHYVKELPMTNTQNKSEEEILEAIQQHYNQFREGASDDTKAA